LNGYNITGDINRRPVHTTRTLHAMLFSVRAVRMVSSSAVA